MSSSTPVKSSEYIDLIGVSSLITSILPVEQNLIIRDLQDNPHVWWDPVLVAEIVEEYVQKWGIDSIITFDDRGVTGHINHRATAAGVRYKFTIVRN